MADSTRRSSTRASEAVARDTESIRYDKYRAVIERFGSFDDKQGAINLLGIRGYVDGQPVDNRPDEFNDSIVAVWRDADGESRVREFLASVDPGQDYTDRPLNEKGCAHLVDGHYRYKRGLHKGRPALVQAEAVRVWRDGDRDHQQDAREVVESGWFGINIHDGGSGEKVGKWSAGCQVVHGGRSGGEWQTFWRLIENHVGEFVGYTLVDRGALGHSLSEGVLPAVGGSPTASRGAALVLRVGSRGVEVRDLQVALASAGFEPGPVDGIFGRKTEAAVIAFQRRNRLHVDGVVGPETLAALSGAKPGPSPRRGKRKALLVAIDDYGDPRNNLPSCVADARAFRRLLEENGFADRDVHVVTNGDAKVQKLEDELEWLFDAASADDRLVLFYSGHGHQLPVDGVMTEVLVLRDGFYVDDELAARTADLPDGVLTVVLDSCFSGGMDKIVFGSVDGSAEFAQPKRWTADASKGARTSSSAAADVHGYRRFGSSKSAGDESGDTPLRGLMLAACSENETASASTSKTDGLSAFTFALLAAIEAKTTSATVTDLMIHVRESLKSMGFRQTPTLFEPPGAFRLASRTFLDMREKASRLPSGDPSEWAPLTALLQNLTKESSMTTETKMDAATEKAFSLFASLLPVLVNAAVSAVRGGGRRKEFETEAEGYVDDDPLEAPEGDNEAMGKFLGALLPIVTSLAPAVAERVLPAVVDFAGNFVRNQIQPRSPRRPRRKDFVAPTGEGDGEANAKAFEMAMRLLLPFLSGNLRIRAA